MLSHLKKNMKTLLLIGALLVPFVASAQELDKPVIDKFTNDTTFSTTMRVVASDDGTGE